MIIINSSKTFCLVPHDRLLVKLAASDVDSKVVVWVREFPQILSRRATIEGSKSNFTCAARERFGPLPFLVHVNDIWRNIDSSIRLFADYCIIKR